MAQRDRIAPSAPPEEPSMFWGLVIGFLILLRFLVPTEGSELGETLWISTLSLAATGIFFWSRARFWNFTIPRFHLTDLGIGLLILGHVASGIVVLLTTGDKRAALNCVWEWVSLGGIWMMLREHVQQSSFQRSILQLLCISTICLAFFGLWQHKVWYPSQAADLNRLVELQEKQQKHELLTRAEEQQLNELTRNVGSEFLSLNDNARQSLINRATQSVEPIGRFALANSFAALMILGTFLLLELTIFHYRNGSSWATLLMLGVSLAVTLLCLLLTKSRTAIIASAVGFAIWGLLQARQGKSLSAKANLPIAGSVVSVLGLMIAGLWFSGGLDKEVVSEAPKSLKYRLEYWQSTITMLREFPVFGVGPGNFRQHYVKYKLPGASEEILDPHNLFLDVWANGGLIALAGLLIFFGRLVFVILKPSMNTQSGDSNVPPIKSEARGKTSSHKVDKNSSLQMAVPVLLTGLLAFTTIFIEQLFFEGFDDLILVGLGVGWLLCGILFLLLVPLSSISVSRLVSILPVVQVAILIHLLGAGGIGMPAILLVLVLIQLLIDPPVISKIDNGKQVDQIRYTLAVGFVISAGFCTYTSLLPHFSASLNNQNGRHALYAEGRTGIAERNFQTAIASDSLSSESQLNMALLSMHQWEQSEHDERKFEKAITHLKRAIELDPYAAKKVLLLSELWEKRAARLMETESARVAIAAAEQGLKLYPTYTPLWVALAVAKNSADENPAQAATQAIMLDDLNLQNQHFDKSLSPIERKKMEDFSKEK